MHGPEDAMTWCPVIPTCTKREVCRYRRALQTAQKSLKNYSQPLRHAPPDMLHKISMLAKRAECMTGHDRSTAPNTPYTLCGNNREFQPRVGRPPQICLGI